MPHNVADASADVKQSAALPNGAAVTQTAGIDLQSGVKADFLAGCELVLTAPALTVGELADAQTITYSIEMDDNAGFSSATVLAASILVQTGAGGAGAVGATHRFRLPSTVERFVRHKATKAGASNASTASMVSQLKF